MADEEKNKFTYECENCSWKFPTKIMAEEHEKSCGVSAKILQKNAPFSRLANPVLTGI